MTDFVKPGILMGAVAVTRYLDAEDPETLFWSRVAFVVGICVAWLLQGLIYLRIKQRNDTTPLTVSESDLDPNAASPLASLMGQGESGKPVELTHQAYDLHQLQSAFKQSLISPVVTLVLHLYFGYFPPLIVGSVLAPLTVATSELGRLHLGSLFTSAAPAKELNRPWRAKGLMTQFKEMKKEVMKELNEVKGEKGATAGQTGSRKNKKAENRRKIGK